MLLTGPFGGLTDDVREFLPARMSPSPSWFALTGAAAADQRVIVAGRW